MLKDRQPHDEPTEQDERTQREVLAEHAGNDARVDEMHDAQRDTLAKTRRHEHGDTNYAGVGATTHTTHVTHADDYEERIREDERARVMQELHALRDEHPDHDRDDRLVDGDRADRSVTTASCVIVTTAIASTVMPMSVTAASVTTTCSSGRTRRSTSSASVRSRSGSC